MTVQMLLEQSRTFYFLWWNKSNIKEIKTTLRFACQINISLKIIIKIITKIFRFHTEFPPLAGRIAHTQKKIKLKLWVLFVDEIDESSKNKYCVIEKMPASALSFAYWYSYNNYVKTVSTSKRQTKLKKILIKQKHVIRIIFHVNEETRPRPVQELIPLIYVK